MRRFLKFCAVAAVLAAAAFFYLTAPNRLPPSPVYDTAGNAAAGERIFNIAGCGSCHMAKGATGDARLVLGGGQEFASPFGTFVAPNISSDVETGIGAWSSYDLANALLRGISPKGSHYYPVLPYTSYARMQPADVVDLRAYLATLPAVSQPNASHDLPLPFRLRRGLGLWKLLFLDDAPIIPNAPDSGRYLVEGLGHCAECHTPRNLIGGLDRSRWLAGAPNPSGEGRIPNITPGAADVGNWSVAELVFYFETGFTPEFDTAGGEMVNVIASLAALPVADREAIAAYLKAIPAQTDAQ
ncbi:MAG: cytochrome c [Paracoccaceae bacterium]